MNFKLKQSPIDARDYTPSSLNLDNPELPESYEPGRKMPVLFQAFSSQCVAHALATALGYCEIRKGWNPNNYSRGFVYANRNGLDESLEGMHIRNALKVLQKEGDCPYYSFRWGQSSLKRTTKKFLERQEELEREALDYEIVGEYYSLSGFEEIKQAIYREGAAVLSISPDPNDFLYFYRKDFGKGNAGDPSRGRHAVCAYGWDGDWLLCQDSYSPLAHFGGRFRLHRDFPVNEAWAFRLDKGREDYVPTANERYAGYLKYLAEWLFGK